MLDILKKMVGRNIPVRLNMAGIGEEMDNLKAQAKRLGIEDKVTFLGGGPDLDRLKQYACDGIKFYGYIPYAEMMSVAKGCDIAVNAIHSYAMQSITNKLSDYMALQKPILNSQVHDEVAEVLTLLPHENYRSGDVDGFVRAAKDILKRKNDPVQSDEIVRRFRRDISYRKIVNLIERLAHE
ncbi:TPA: glycosyltransferase [Neisseria gonorrhoeae]